MDESTWPHRGSSGRAAAGSFRPTTRWMHRETAEFLERTFGERWEGMSWHLPRPTLETCIRVNTLKATREEVIQRLRDKLPGYDVQEGELPMSVIVKGEQREGAIVYDDRELEGREMIVGLMAGEAMLKGAELYVPGILASTKGLQAGDLVAVSIALPKDPEKKTYGVTRQTTLPAYVPLDDERFPNRENLFIGVGEVMLNRKEIVNPTNGMALRMKSRVYNLPSLPNEFLSGLIMNQAFPSMLAACVLSPTPGSTVLDMCAAPGGKTTALAQIMGNQGTIFAVDRSNKKVLRVEELAQSMGLTIVEPLKGDACSLYNPEKSSDEESHSTPTEAVKSAKYLQAEERRRLNRIRHGHDAVDSRKSAKRASGGFAGNTFDFILLDAPCSALGLRPRLNIEYSISDLLQCAQYSRKMIDQAVQLLKPGGALVFSTCTISPLENEGNVRYLLDKYPFMKLVEAGPGLHFGEKGLEGTVTTPCGRAFDLLNEDEARLVQRFYPGDNDVRSCMGFFISKFVKMDVGAC